MNRRQPERGRHYAGDPPDHDPRPERRDEGDGLLFTSLTGGGEVRHHTQARDWKHPNTSEARERCRYCPGSDEDGQEVSTESGD